MSGSNRRMDMCQTACRIPLNQMCRYNLMLDPWCLQLHPKQRKHLHPRKGRILKSFSASRLSPTTLKALQRILEG